MAQMLINKLLDSNSSSRYTADKALLHPWITRRIYDSIPQTFFETIRNKQILKKAKTAIGAMLFLSKLSKNNAKYNEDNIPRDYLLRMEQINAIQKNNFKTYREKSFEICNNEEKNISNSRRGTINKTGIEINLAQGIYNKRPDVMKSLKFQFNGSPGNSISPRIVQKEDMTKAGIKMTTVNEDGKSKKKNWGNNKTSRIKEKEKNKEAFPMIKESLEQNIRTSNVISVSPEKLNKVSDERFKIELKRVDQSSKSPDSVAKCASSPKYAFNNNKGVSLEAKNKGSLSISPKKVDTKFEYPKQKKYSHVCIVGPITKDSNSMNQNGSNVKILPLVLPNISYPYPVQTKMKKKKKKELKFY